MKVNNTYLGSWLSLIRIQSTPVTVIPLCLGYATFSQTTSLGEIAALMIVGGLGHWTFYAMNDYLDLSHDIKHKEVDKPLVSGEISKATVEAVLILGMSLTLIVSSLLLNTLSFSMYLAAMAMGLIYNAKSKAHTLSGVYLFFWGWFVVLAGSLHAGGINIFSQLVGVAIGSHMLLMTFQGDLKDLHADEPCITRALGCRLEVVDPPGKLIMPFQFKTFWWLIQIVVIAASMSMLLMENHTETVIVLAAVSYMLLCLSSKTLITDQKYITGTIKKKIVFQTVMTVAIISVSSLSFTSVYYIASIAGGSVLWGLGWQKIQYGKALYFP